MKKKLLVAIVAIFSLNTAQAQMPNGSTGPDFTATDLDGNTINLYADFLDQGIPVIMDVSATWCGPCWGFHQGHALKDIYMGSGMGGSQEIGVIFVEGDGSTGLAQLQGSGNTAGDWITGTPYPILDNASIASSYQIAYYPTIYGICPDRTVYEIGSGTVAALKQALITNCSSVTSFSGTVDNVATAGESMEICSGSDVTPSASVHNYGTNAVTTLTAELFEAGVAIDVVNWTGNLAAGGDVSVQFNPIQSIASAVDYEVVISNPNGNTDNYPTLNQSDINIDIAPSTTEVSATFKITLDNYGSETTWNIKDGAGAMLASGGPYTDGTSGTQYTEEIDLLSDGCYSITISDSYGDGLLSPGRYSLMTPTAYIYNVTGGSSFGNLLVEPFLKGSGSSTSITNSTINKLNIYPNPTSGVLNIEGLYSLVEIFDIFGKLVLSSEYTNSIDVSSLANGIYNLNIVNETGVKNMKITISK